MTGTITAAQLEAAKDYMRLDGTDDDVLITSLYLTAKQYLANAGVPEPEDVSLDPQYTLLVHGLTLWYYDKRDVTDGSQADMPAGLRQAITQRKLVGSGSTVYTA